MLKWKEGEKKMEVVIIGIKCQSGFIEVISFSTQGESEVAPAAPGIGWSGSPGFICLR